MTFTDTTADTSADGTADGALSEVMYRGVQPPRGGPGRIDIWTPAGRLLGPLHHFVKHSPTGMAWGYEGSGASDCARSLLAAAIGEQLAACPACRADPQAAPGCPCDAGLIMPTPQIYHEFKRVFVAHWGGTFVISRRAIIGWLRGHFPEQNWPTIID